MDARSPSGALDTIVVGGGVIGLAIARQRALQGERVALIEKERPGAAASGAAAGMLAPLAEMSGSAMLEMGLLARELYPGWVAQIEMESGLETGFHACGLLQLALSPVDEAALDELQAAHSQAGLPVHRLTRAEVEGRLPGLSPEVRSGLEFAGEARVDPRRLVAALARAAASAGVAIRLGAPVSAIEPVPGGSEVVCGDERLFGRQIVVAAGCWSAGLLSLDPELTAPVRGQMVALRPDRIPSSAIIAGPSVYLVPQPGGVLYVGATVEHVGFDARPTAAGIEGLLAGARRMFPELASAAVQEVWAGLRPGTPDGRPTVGGLEPTGLFVATGHYRNGILLAPATARLLSDLMDGVEPNVDPSPFSPDRHRAGLRRA